MERSNIKDSKLTSSTSNENVNQIKNEVKLMKLQHHQEQLNELRLKFSDQQKRLNELNQEQGASRWLTTLPILDEDYDLTKQLFLGPHSDKLPVDFHKITY